MGRGWGARGRVGRSGAGSGSEGGLRAELLGRPPALPRGAGRPRGGACRGGEAGTGAGGGARHGLGTRRPHGWGGGRRGRRRPLAPGPVPPPSARSPRGPTDDGPDKVLGGERARAGFCGPGRPPASGPTANGGGAGRRMRGARGRGPRALAAGSREGALGPGGRPLLRLLPGARASAAVAGAGGCAEVESGTSETLVLWLLPGRKGPPGGASVPSPLNGRAGASPTGGGVSRSPWGSPELGSPRRRQSDPQGRVPGGCSPKGKAHWRVS